MRAHGLDITSSESGAAALYFFDRHGRKRYIPSELAPRVPRQAFDPVCLLIWLVLVPFTAGWFWYAIYGLIRAFMERI